ncbi:MAG: cupin domain-containing protein [Limisphaerales bacterium]
MTGVIEKQEKKSFAKPDDKRSFDKGQVEVVTVGEMTIGRQKLQPGWSWSSCVKPIAKTEFCQASHLICQVSGRMHVKMEDGSEFEIGPGEVATIPPGHDAWVVGNEPVVGFDITGAGDYAKPG